MRLTSLCGAALLALCGAGAAFAADEELPVWPHEQQAMLRQVEDDLLAVQRKLFKARQFQDQAAVESSSEEFRQLQDTRRKLINLTKDQLPAE